MPSRKPRDDSHSAGPDRRRYGLPRGWRSVAAYRHYLNKQSERHAKGEIDTQSLLGAIAAAKTGTELLMVEAKQRRHPEGLETVPDHTEDEQGTDDGGEAIEAEFEEVEVEERPDGSARIVVLNTPRKDEG